MRNSLKYYASVAALLALVAAIVLGCGRSDSKAIPDPLAGWQKAYKEEPSQAIEKDYRDFIQKLQSEGKGQAQVTGYYKNESGQHLINIEIFEHDKNASWQYALVYDKDDKRVKMIKYGYVEYQS